MLNFIKNIFTRSAETPSTGSLAINDDFWYGITGSLASAGISVSRETAMRQWAVYACVTEIAQMLAQLPLKLKRPAAKGGTEDATDHPLYDICKNTPCPQMTSFNWREAQQANLLTAGNNYNFIERTRLGVRALWPSSPSATHMRPASNTEAYDFRLNKHDRIVYDIHTVSGVKTYASKDILHIAGFGYDGLKGESVISNFAREAIGNAIAIDQFQGAAMRNGVRPSGVLEHPDTLGDSSESFMDALRRRWAGNENTGVPMVLENGMKFNKLDVSFVDKQFVEQANLSFTAICGIFKVPPHRIAIYKTNTNYNNTEQGNKAFLDNTMQQWVIRWEQAMNWKLLTADERREGYAFKFNFDALLRPDAKTRSEMSWREWQQGTPLNEIRMRDDMPPIEGGDVAYVPVNMVPYHLAGKQQQTGQKLVDRDVDNLRSLFRNMAEREIRKQKDGKGGEFGEWLVSFRSKVYGIIERDISLTVTTVNDDVTAEKIMAEIKNEFDGKINSLVELQKRNWINYEEVIQ